MYRWSLQAFVAMRPFNNIFLSACGIFHVPGPRIQDDLQHCALLLIDLKRREIAKDYQSIILGFDLSFFISNLKLHHS
jgi:hypothetical protein